MMENWSRLNDYHGPFYLNLSKLGWATNATLKYLAMFLLSC